MFVEDTDEDRLTALMVTKMKLLKVTEFPVTTEDEMNTELLGTEIKLHKKTMEHTRHVLHIPE